MCVYISVAVLTGFLFLCGIYPTRGSTNARLCVHVNLHQEQAWRGGRAWTVWHLQHGGYYGTLRSHGNDPPGSSRKLQRCPLEFEKSSIALAPVGVRGGLVGAHTHNIISKATRCHESEFSWNTSSCSHIYLEDGIHDTAERSVVGEFCYSEDVKTPLVQILQLLVEDVRTGTSINQQSMTEKIKSPKWQMEYATSLKEPLVFYTIITQQQFSGYLSHMFFWVSWVDLCLTHVTQNTTRQSKEPDIRCVCARVCVQLDLQLFISKDFWSLFIKDCRKLFFFSFRLD